MKSLEKATHFDGSEMKKLLIPVWETQDIVGETGIIVGEDGAVCLLGAPVKGSVVVKNVFCDTLYEEGVDYKVEGNRIVRIVGGDLPYFPTEEYFRKEPNAAIKLKADAKKIGIPFAEQRYIYFSEGVDGFSRYISVSYTVSEKLSGDLITKDERLQAFVEKLQTEKRARIKFYGDSITVGCNATGTQYGGNVSPYLPNWITLVTTYLKKKFSAEIMVENHAVGGWSSVNGIDKFEQKCRDGLEETDLFCIGFGANDLLTPPEEFKKNLMGMMTEYFNANPNGYVLLYSSLLSNEQVVNWRLNQPLFENVLLELANERARVGVAKVSTVFSTLEGLGKPSRDWLANSINHPTDFGVRIYAQVILTTLLGNKM